MGGERDNSDESVDPGLDGWSLRRVTHTRHGHGGRPRECDVFVVRVCAIISESSAHAAILTLSLLIHTQGRSIASLTFCMVARRRDRWCH
jgi:hypothetical protein